jgi:hypothetical protein
VAQAGESGRAVSVFQGRAPYVPGPGGDADPAERMESALWRELSQIRKVSAGEFSRACAGAVQRLLKEARVYGVGESERERQAEVRRAMEGAYTRRDVPR